MCNCGKKICLLKLKFINYVNDNMLKETNKALELIDIINCGNLENIIKELNGIIQNLEYGTKTLEAFTTIDCQAYYENCINKCSTSRCKDECLFIVNNYCD